MGNKLKIFLLILLAIVFFGLRFYNLEKRVGFAWDQETYSYQVKNIIKDHKLTLIGPRNSDVKGFFLGPYFTYILVPFYLFTNLHPSALVFFVILVNILFFVSAIYLLKNIYDIKTALLFLLVWSVNKQLVQYDTIPWNPIFIPIGILLVWSISKRIFNRNSLVDWILLGLLNGLFLNLHFSFIFINIFSFFFLIFFVFEKKSISLLKIASASISFLSTFLPLLLFDLRHDFLNSKLFIDFFFSQKEKLPPSDIFNWLPVFNNFYKGFLLFQNNYLMIFFYLMILSSLIFFSFKEKLFNKIFYRAILIMWILLPVFFNLYGKRPSEYYFYFTAPFVYVTIINIFSRFKKINWLVFLIIFLTIINFKSLIKVFDEDLEGLYYKDLAVKRLAVITSGKSKFNISYKVPIGQSNGYNYLIDYYEIKQSGNFNDTLLEIIVPADGNIERFGNVGLKIPIEFKYEK